MDLAAVQAVQGFVGRLVDGDHTAVDNLLDESTMSGPQVRAALAERKGTLVFPPEAAYDRLAAEAISRDGGETYEAPFRLYTAEQGRSPLELDLRIHSEGDGLYDLDVRRIR